MGVRNPCIIQSWIRVCGRVLYGYSPATYSIWSSVSQHHMALGKRGTTPYSRQLVERLEYRKIEYFCAFLQCKVTQTIFTMEGCLKIFCC